MKPCADHPVADRGDDVRAQHDVLVQPLAAQIQEAIGQPRLFRIIQIAEHRQRQFLRLPCIAASSMRISTSPVGRSLFTVSGERATTLPVNVTTHSERALSARERRRIRLDHALGDAIMVAQVDEHQPAMVAPAVDPAGQPDGLSDIVLAKLAASMGAIGVHGVKTWKGRVFGVYGGRSRAAGWACGRFFPSQRPVNVARLNGIAMKFARFAAFCYCRAGRCPAASPSAAAQHHHLRGRRPALWQREPGNMPNMFQLKTEGVDFTNSHSLFPTITTVNASAIATGHYIGDTGDFGNTILPATPMISRQRHAHRGAGKRYRADRDEPEVRRQLSQ